MEQAIISGVASDDSEAKITMEDVPDRPGVAATIFRALAEEGVNVDMIVQNVSHQGRTDISFTAPKTDVPRIRATMERITEAAGGVRYTLDEGIAKVSLVGAGMKSHPGVAAEMFAALAEEGINIEMISTSSIRISCVIQAADAERAVTAVHDRFAIAKETVAREEHA